MWTMNERRRGLEVINGERGPSLCIQNVTYLNSAFRTWETGSIWIDGRRILYVGPEEPPIEADETIDGTGKFAVPGYVEPHVHPSQLYTIETYAHFGSQTGTTVYIADNLIPYMEMEERDAHRWLDHLQQLPEQIYSWVRFDSQTRSAEEADVFNEDRIASWLTREDVLLGGELTAWPALMNGSSRLEAMMGAMKQRRLKVEGHLPGASERTLVRMRLLGVDGDHESMTIEDVRHRLQHGYAVTLRYSSIRPDLPHLLRAIREKGWDVWDRLMMTTDGSTPLFHKKGLMNELIEIALQEGVDPIDAYHMASYNVARYYDRLDEFGQLTTGCLATLNILNDPNHPTPVDVLAKGQWLVREGEVVERRRVLDWSNVRPFTSVPCTAADFEWTSPDGIELVNDVITKRYESTVDRTLDAIPPSFDESYLLVIGRDGTWRVNTMLKGFGAIEGLASSYSTSGDFVIIGTSKVAMRRAYEAMCEAGGGIFLADESNVQAYIPLPIGGRLPDLSFEDIRPFEQRVRTYAKEKGYRLGDFIYTLLFLQSTHLPYVRITPEGLIDVLSGESFVLSEKR